MKVRTDEGGGGYVQGLQEERKKVGGCFVSILFGCHVVGINHSPGVVTVCRGRKYISDFTESCPAL